MSRENVRALIIVICTAILAVLGVRVVPQAGCQGEIPPELPPQIPIPPPVPGPPIPPPDTQPDVLNAIARIRTTVGGCSATIIGPRRSDGAYDMLSAAHCISTIGENVDVLFRDGRRTSAKVVNFDKRADWCWLIMNTNTAVYPYALLADSSPPVGTKIWHAGFGVDRPGNREDGEVLSSPQANGRIRMLLSVSSGDSGGGFAITQDGKIFSCCCCTVWDGRSQWTEGASTEAIRAGRTAKIDLWDWNPVKLPRIDTVDVPKEMPK